MNINFCEPSLKTLIQERIECSVTNYRNYQTVPYSNLFGQKKALKQWLLFSETRCINLYNCSSDKTRFLRYLSFFIDKRFIRKPIETYVIALTLGEISKLEKKTA